MLPSASSTAAQQWMLGEAEGRLIGIQLFYEAAILDLLQSRSVEEIIVLQSLGFRSCLAR